MEEFHDEELEKLKQIQDIGPDSMKEYYIGYFDVLGYKAFFTENNNNVNLLLATITEIVSQVKGVDKTARDLPLCKMLNLQLKFFSDNVLLSIEVLDSLQDGIRLMMFLTIIADVQRMCLQKFGLLIRGGVTRGPLVITEDFVFGKGLVDVVSLEERANYPRIVVDTSINDFFQKRKEKIAEEVAIFLQQEKETVADLSEQEKALSNRLGYELYIARVIQSLIWQDADGVDFLNYLYKIHYRDILTPEVVAQVENLLENYYPQEYEVTQNSNYDYPSMLEQVREKLVEKLLYYGQYDDLKNEDVKPAEVRESVLKKYLWTMRFYNLMCSRTQYDEKIIPASANVDGRFLRMIIQMGALPAVSNNEGA